MNNKSQSKILPIFLISLVLLESFFVYLVIAGSFDPEDDRPIGYEYLNSSGDVVEEVDGKVIHIWNTEYDYFFNKTSGIQFTNHFNEYWTHNIFCGGHKDASNNWVYKCNDALPFIWDIKTDNLTYVNYTGYRDIAIGTKKVRTAIRYHLKLNDLNMTIQLYIKNIGTEDINTDLGFAWKSDNIQIGGDKENDWIQLNNSFYNLSEELDLTFTNMSEGYNTTFKYIPFYKIFDVDRNQFLRLDWNKNLNYRVKLKTTPALNGSVTLGINIGNLLAGQEKQTEMYWIDANEQFARPDSDVADGGWTDEGSSENDEILWNSVDEVTKDDDVSYISALSGDTTFEVGLSDVTDPDSSIGHIFHVYSKVLGGGGGPEKLNFYLMQGATIIATKSNYAVVDDVYTDIALTLDTTEADAITNYADLRMKAEVVALGAGEEIRITQGYLEVPEAVAEDNEYPQFSDYWDDNATLEDLGTGHFNVTLLSTNGTVLLDINGENITATNLTANVYNASYTFSSGNVYAYRWHSWGNGTSHNYNQSIERSYTVNVSAGQSLEFLDDTDVHWNLGTMNNMTVEGSGTEANLTSNASSGSFVSRIFDAGSSVDWKNITYTLEYPYGEELPANQVDENWMNMTGNVLLMHFNNDSSIGENDTHVYDYSGMGNNGSVNGSIWSSSGKLNGAFEFDGVDDYISCGNDNSLDINDAITISAWVKPETSSWAGFVAKDMQYSIGLYSNTMELYWYYPDVRSGLLLTQSQWNYVAVYYNKSEGKMRFRVNDQTSVVDSTAAMNTDADSLTIGSRKNDHYLTGFIDEVAIWNRSLSSEEIKNLYNRGAVKFNVSVRSCDDNVCSGESWRETTNNASFGRTEGLTDSDNQYFQYMFNYTNSSDAVARVNDLSVWYDSGADETKPTYSGHGTNTTVAGGFANFYVLYNDNTALHPNGEYIFSTNNTGNWANKSAVSFTTTPEWANATLTLNSTTGTVVGYRWYANDSAGNVNNTDIFILTIAAADTCTYTSGNWIVDCSDYCNITSNVNVGTNNIILSGTGYFNILANVTCEKFAWTPTCKIINVPGDNNELRIEGG